MILRKEKIVYLIALFGVLSNNIYSQTDSPGRDNVHLSEYYAGIGIGFGHKGFFRGLCGTFVSSNDWGGSICVKKDSYKSENIPGDFFETQFVIFGPRDKVNFISLKLLKEFPSSGKKVEYAIEAGPSLVNQKIAQFSINPNYPNGGIWGLPVNKYIKSYAKEESIGISLRAKVEFPIVSYFGIEFAIISEINRLQSFTGLECCLNLGKIGD